MREDETTPRPPLTRQRIVQAAVTLVDRDGLDALTMRRLGAELGVEAMSLYKHVSNKDEILDGIVEMVIGEIEIPSEGADWRSAMRQRAVSARAVFTRHSWAVGLLEARGSMSPTTMRYLDAVLGNLMSAGFSIENAVHAFWLLDSFVYGQVIQETSFPVSSEGSGATTASMLEQITNSDYPHLVEVGEHAMTFEYSVEDEFEFGLDLILDALDRRATEAGN